MTIQEILSVQPSSIFVLFCYSTGQSRSNLPSGYTIQIPNGKVLGLCLMHGGILYIIYMNVIPYQYQQQSSPLPQKNHSSMSFLFFPSILFSSKIPNHISYLASLHLANAIFVGSYLSFFFPWSWHSFPSSLFLFFFPQRQKKDPSQEQKSHKLVFIEIRLFYHRPGRDRDSAAASATIQNE